jgi:RNA polymerase sigma factor (sigma-70 family)
MDQNDSGRKGAFNALYDAHYAAVRAYAWRREPEFADDIVAETFLVAWRRFEDIPAEAALPWLLIVSRNALLNMQRGERRRREREWNVAERWSPDEADVPWEPSDQARGPVWQALRQLSSGDREVLLLVAWEELDRAEIAKMLGCSRANVALRVHRARRRFQALLESTGDSLDPRTVPSLETPSSLSPQGVSHE